MLTGISSEYLYEKKEKILDRCKSKFLEFGKGKFRNLKVSVYKI